MFKRVCVRMVQVVGAADGSRKEVTNKGSSAFSAFNASVSKFQLDSLQLLSHDFTAGAVAEAILFQLMPMHWLKLAKQSLFKFCAVEIL